MNEYIQQLAFKRETDRGWAMRSCSSLASCHIRHGLASEFTGFTPLAEYFSSLAGLLHEIIHTAFNLHMELSVDVYACENMPKATVGVA